MSDTWSKLQYLNIVQTLMCITLEYIIMFRILRNKCCNMLLLLYSNEEINVKMLTLSCKYRLSVFYSVYYLYTHVVLCDKLMQKLLR